jgi:hypothetical protein
MPLSRNNRIDRRRKALLEAAYDPELASEHTKIVRRNRAKAKIADETVEEAPTTYRDPGYSQAVRRACQQRVVQLIPVRRGMVAAALTCLWCGFAILVGLHYWLHVVPLNANKWNFALLPIARLFDLSGWNSISQWLSCQLWLLTAIAAGMTLNLRRHKLDDYRARYRVWGVVALVALFLHFDAGTSTLLLLGHTLDPWARAEIGYGGWPLVLATTASLVGMLGIRLCSELKTVPASVSSWLIGLLAVAGSSLLGTGLIKTTWDPAMLRLLSGSLWLGGALAVFQAIAMYLRHTYIQAQKRFLTRSGVSLKPLQFTVPSLRRAKTTEDGQELPARRWRDRLPWMGNREDSYDEEQIDDEEPTTKNLSRWEEELEEVEPKKLLGILPNRQMANSEKVYEPIAEDDGGPVDRGLTKAAGWFNLGGNRNRQDATEPTTKQSRKEKLWADATNRGESKPEPNVETEAQERRRWLSWKRRESTERTERPERSERTERDPAADSIALGTPTPSTWGRAKQWVNPKNALSKFGRKKTSSSDEADRPAKTATDEGAQPKKKGLFGLVKKSGEPKPKKEVAPKAPKEPKPPREKKSWFGMFDGFKLKPPTNDGSQDSNKSPAPVSLRQATGSGDSRPSTQGYTDEQSDDRPLSKADRKRLRQQQNDRRAA